MRWWLAILIVLSASTVVEARPCPKIARGAVRRLVLPRGPAVHALTGTPWTLPLGRFDPCANRWTPVDPAVGTPGDSALLAIGPTRIASWRDGAGRLFDGGRWRTISAQGAPAPRSGQVVTWLGDQVMVWGGGDAAGAPTSEGAIYDLATDRWTATPTTGAPSPRLNPAWAALDGRLLVWGGEAGRRGAGGPALDGAIFDPATGAWTALPARDAPGDAVALQIIADGGGAVVWSQFGRGSARLDLATSTWTPIPGLPSGAPGTLLREATLPGLFAVDTGGALWRLVPGAGAWRALALPAAAPSSPWRPRPGAGGLVFSRTAPRARVDLEVAILGADETWSLLAIPTAARSAARHPRAPAGAGPIVFLDDRRVAVLDVAARRWRTTRIPAAPWWQATVMGDFVVVWGKARSETREVTYACGCEGQREPGAPACDPGECQGTESVDVIDPAGVVVRWR